MEYKITGRIHITKNSGEQFMTNFCIPFNDSPNLILNNSFLKTAMLNVKNDFSKDESWNTTNDKIIIMSATLFKLFEEEWIPIL